MSSLMDTMVGLPPWLVLALVFAPARLGGVNVRRGSSFPERSPS